MSEEQKAALEKLNEALQACTDSGFFDSAEAWDCIHPDVINAFCEGVERIEVTPK